MAVEPIFESYGNKLIGVPNNEESGGSGGHVIENSSGTDLPQEDTLQFADSHVSDDSTNGKTVVETFKAVTEAEYSSETEDGAYIITDGDGATIGPASEDYVLAEADGTKTWQQLLNSIWSDADKSKITDNAYIYIDGTILAIVYKGSNGQCIFTLADVSSQVPASSRIKLASYSTFEQYSSATYQNKTTDIATADVRLYYGQKKAVVDLQTTANRCLYDSNTTVKQKIDADNVKFNEVVFQSDSPSVSYTFYHGLNSGGLGLLIITRYGLYWACLYNSGQDSYSSKVVGASDASRSISSLSYNSTTHEITISFSGGMYGGITVIAT